MNILFTFLGKCEALVTLHSCKRPYMHSLNDYLFANVEDVLYNLSSYAPVLHNYSSYDPNIVWCPSKARLIGCPKNYKM